MLIDSVSFLIGACLRATVVLGLAWALTSIMRRASAATRHFAWTCAIAAALLEPLASQVVPQWPVASPPLLASLRGRPGAGDWGLGAGNIQPSTLQSRVPRQGAIIASSDDRTAGGPRSASSTVSPSAPASGPGYAGAALSLWAAGTGVILFSMISGAIAAWWMRRTGGRADAPWVAQAHRLAAAFEIPGPIACVESVRVTTPMVCGLWRPLMIMPPGAAHWSEERRRVVVLHELAHIKRRDCLTQALAQIACAVYWFNPIVWIAARRLRAERERACDDFVLAAGTKGSDYAGHLLEIARTMRAGRLSPLAAAGLAMAHRSQLEGRLMAILDPAVRRSSALPARVAVVTAVLLLAIPVAAVQLQTPVPGTRDVRAVAAIGSAPKVESPAAPVAPPAAVRAGQGQIEPQPRASERTSRALNRALLEAAEDGDLDGLSTLLLAGANVNAEIAGDGSPLIVAAREGRLAVVWFLLDRGADPNLIVRGDGSAIILAAREGHADVVDLLLHRGADPNLMVRGDGSAIILAAREGHADVVDLLLQRGAIVDQVAPGDENALIQASARGQLNTVKLLVARGADVNMRVWVDERGFGRPEDRRDGEWRTPLNMARRRGHGAVVAYLLSAGARE